MGATGKIRDNAKAAIMNKVFYDLAADVYEEADGRRGSVPEYMEDLISFQATGQSEFLIDLGAGTGFASKVAAKYYKEVYALDISPQMLGKIRQEKITTCQVDITQDWRLSYMQADKIIAISTLHHIPEYSMMLKQVAERLKSGGFFYSDLDLDDRFAKIWRWPLKLYRRIRRAGKKYERLQPAVSEGLHDVVEIHSDGIPTDQIRTYLEMLGFTVDVIYHWGNGRAFPRGLAPFVCIWAVK